ncbi:MAG: hypothetical protein ABFR75_03680, partial [Acidobacteriota bacterium]
IMKKISLILFIFNLIFVSCAINKKSNIIELKSKFFKTSIDKKGCFVNFIDIKTGKDHISGDFRLPVLSVRINKQVLAPRAAEVKNNILTLKYNKGVEANIKIEQKRSHLTFELLSITNKKIVELVIWGPYHTTINKIISETVGVVRGEKFALGIQALNIKTLGGYPWFENDRMPQIDIFRQTDPDNMKPENPDFVLFRVEAAKPTATGSSLQAYCRNRSEARIIKDFRHEKIVAPAYDDGGVTGSKIALFGCPVEKALETIGKIEIAEGLPHPMLDGKWVKTAPGAAASYLIMNFSEKDIDNAIKITKKAGLRYLYHPGKIFKSWGHFKLYEKAFPNGYEGMKMCVNKAEEQGIRIGTHVLSNFITTNDPYITPVPDKRLAKVGTTIITEDVDEDQTEIFIESPDFFNQYKNNNLKTVQSGDELIRYGKVSASPPWKLLDCKRGAFKTKVFSHRKGDKISKLLDHSYKVFLTETDLTIELSKNIAELFNRTGLRQVSFDGLEGNRSTGLGSYGESLMPYTWYNYLSDDKKNDLIVDGSCTTHFFWHIYSRMNWGEPWYAGFRESQTQYRLKNQPYFKRNFMPGMLGWFKMTPGTTIEDIEWLLARSAAFDAGYAFVASYESVEKNGNTDKILELIGEWEKVRLAGLFTDEQKERMEDTEKEFSLKKVDDHKWNLYQVYSGKFKHEKKVRQPGEPLYSTFIFKNEGKEQIMSFILNSVDSDISEITMEIDNYKEIKFPVTLKTGEIIKYQGGGKAYVYDENWQVVGEFNLDSSDFKVNKGEHSITFDCKFNKKGKEPMVKLEIRTLGTAEKIVESAREELGITVSYWRDVGKR